MSRFWEGRGRRVEIVEVGPRDGLQAEPVFVSTEDKVALVDALSATGLAGVEVTAFVSAVAIPQMRDAEAVLGQVRRAPGVVLGALVPNRRGAERAIAAGAQELNLVMSASESHNLANLGMDRAQSLAALTRSAALAHEAGLPVNVSMSCSFGCPMEGDIPENELLEACLRCVAEVGAQGMTLCDTTGMAYPTQVARLTEAFLRRLDGTRLTLHFHDTRGMALANVLAAIDAGADRFDAALGGLGGCPYAPGASGNVCTEDLVHALHWMGYDTGVDLDALLAASRRLPALVGHAVPSALLAAGRRLDLHPRPARLAGRAHRASMEITP